MNPAVRSKMGELFQLCAKHRVRRLALFGSAAVDRSDSAPGDIDLLVEFYPLHPVQHANSFFGLAEDLQRLLGLPVDLIESEAIRNPYFKRSVEATEIVLYEAA